MELAQFLDGHLEIKTKTPADLGIKREHLYQKGLEFIRGFNPVEAKVEKEKLCDHLKMFEDTGDVKFMHKNGKGGCVGMSYDKFKFCPICAAPRPKEPKGLAEVLKEAWWSKKSERFAPAKGGYEREADAAINWMLEKVDSLDALTLNRDNPVHWIDKDELKRKVKGE